MNSDLFEGWLEHVFAVELQHPDRSVIIIDNAAFHRREQIYEIADEYGFRVMFLPPYSPDLNSIEQFWANVKKRLRFHMHKFGTFWDALAHAFQ